MKNIHFDMETHDFDDVLTLVLLATNKDVNLVSVTINCGIDKQVGLVKDILEKLNRADVLVGASNMKNRGNGEPISPIHYRVMPNFKEAKPDGYAEAILHNSVLKYPDLIILTGAWLANIAAYLNRYPKDTISCMYIQGGFAGANMVKPENQLDKFKGKDKIRTYNFGCDADAAKTVLNSKQIQKRMLVSKNVCHGTTYNKAFHNEMQQIKSSNIGFKTLVEFMAEYLTKKPEKMLHDPLMMLSCLDDNICTFAEVELSEDRGVWGSKLSKGSNTYISVACDYNRFYQDIKTMWL